MKLGKFETNNIYLGDSYELIKEIPDKSIDLIYVDIPYLIGNGGTGDNELAHRITKENAELGNKGSMASMQKKEQELKYKMDHAKTREEYEKYHCLHSNLLNKMNLESADIVDGINYSILDEFVRVMRYIYIYIWCSKEQIHDLMSYFIDKHQCRFNLLVWCKQNCVPATNNSWLPNVEYCLVFKGKGAPRYNDGYENKSKWYISPTNKSDKDLFNHPTIKPIELVKRHLLHSTQQNDIVADFYLGSGTTCVAAKQLGRQYIGFEINEKYYKIAKDRLNGVNQKGEMNLFETDFDKVEQEHLEQMKLDL